MSHSWLYGIIMVCLLFSCRNRSSTGVDDEFYFTDTFAVADSFGIHQEAMEDIIENLASPVEIAGLLNKINAPFSNTYLASTDYLDDYNTTFKKAVALGVFGADLGYLNMYNINNTVLDYLSAVKSLADDLKVGQFFDFTTLKRLATNSENLDSLMFLSVRSFNQMDQYLRENKRGHLSSLIMGGLWIEGMHLATQVAKTSPHPDLYNRIGEQKIVIPDLLALLGRYREDPKFEKLVSDLENVKNSFDKVTITYEMGEPEMIEKEGKLIFIQNETSHVEMPDTLLQEITLKIEDLRNQLIGI